MLAGRYAMERELGRGGMAVVYLARDLRHQRDVAVKVFATEGAPAGIRDRFLHEIQIAAGLAHPSILPVHDSGEAAGLLYYVMPYVPGESLRERLDREGALPSTEALTIAAEVAGALAYAHSHGVVHRDIKPDNILLVAGHSVLADFGIARAISASGWSVESATGGADGTPTYMSPEEASGGRVDGRSDIYSLGCVMYEMLTGMPPFQGRSPEELAAQHLESDPVPLQARRPSLSREMQLAVARALAKHPADRYQTAQELADRLARWIGQPPVEASRLSRPEVVRATREVPRVLRWALLLGVAGIALFGVTSGISLHQMTMLGDRDRYLVTPFVQRDSALVGVLRGDQSARLLLQSITRWRDVSVVDGRLVADRVMQLGHEPSLFDYERIAGEAKAGRVVAGEVYRVGDSIRVRGVLYDLRTPTQPEREYTITLGLTLKDVDSKFAILADSLLLEGPHTGIAAGGAMGTRVLAAWQAYDSGHVALARWDLTAATRHFQEAVSRDPDYGLAHLWLAQTREWRGEPAERWRDDASRGIATTPPLSDRDLSWALALAALGDARYPEACDRYNAMLLADSLDFRGWYGRAECRALDHLVVPDPKSPTGWRWRSSYQAAIRDFERALTLIPSSHLAFRGAAFSRLSALFSSELSMLRRGVRSGAGADAMGGEFWAFPTLDHDTLAFYPVASAPLVGQPTDAPPPAAVGAAIENGRRSLLNVTRDWARAFPTSAEARASFGLALERTGELADGSVGADSVERQFSAALRYATDADFRVRIAASLVRVMVKRGRFATAAALADSLLAANPEPSIAASPLLAAAAALRGRASLAAALSRRSAAEETLWGPDGAVLQVPLPLRETALAFETYATLGGPADSLAALEQRARVELAGMIPEPQRTTIGMALFDRGQALLFPDTLSSPLVPRHTSTDYLFALAELVRDGKTDEARRTLASVRDRRRNMRLTDLALEATVQEFDIDLAVGDTAAATAGLDAVLGSVATQGSDLLERVAPTAALVQAMACRARLAKRGGDAATAARFATAVRVLWSGADAGFQGVLAEMKNLSRNSGS